MHGGENLAERVARQRAELQSHAVELDAQRAREALLESERAKLDESLLAHEEQYTSLRDEADAKGSKLRALLAKYRANGF